MVNGSLFDYDTPLMHFLSPFVLMILCREELHTSPRIGRTSLSPPKVRVFDVHDRLVKRSRSVASSSTRVYAFRACTIGSKWCKLG